MAKTVYLVYKDTNAMIAGTITDEEYADLIATGWTEKGDDAPSEPV